MAAAETIQLTIVRIEGYGPWTLTLGSDRESQLQMLQARIYYDTQRLFSERGCIVFFNRFDEYFAVTNGLAAADHAAVQQELGRLYPDLKMSMAVGSGETALEANMQAYNARKEEKRLLLSSAGDARIFGFAGGGKRRMIENGRGDGSSGDIAQIMHIDVDSSTKVGARLSPYEVTALVMKVYSRIADEFLRLGSLTFFLGGDNFMVLANGVTKEQAAAAIKKAAAGTDIKLNCGIGVGRTGRKAAAAATEALDTIRELRDRGEIRTVYEVRRL